MRISDWSSDVCSSDLLNASSRHPAEPMRTMGIGELIGQPGSHCREYLRRERRGSLVIEINVTAHQRLARAEMLFQVPRNRPTYACVVNGPKLNRTTYPSPLDSQPITVTTGPPLGPPAEQ